MIDEIIEISEQIDPIPEDHTKILSILFMLNFKFIVYTIRLFTYWT